eukprot:TRINITY_DN300_c2_g1_i2.p1 TRINITY_DN300_c2_g1~~TRINITY_DN300_c2_g1_i2.p1  ORF type:complete len:101 (+),score=3.53 TRINITY_DN300_c2_g1_i2:726-1028(+)
MKTHYSEANPCDSDLGQLPQVDFEFPFKIALGPWPTPHMPKRSAPCLKGWKQKTLQVPALVLTFVLVLTSAGQPLLGVRLPSTIDGTKLSLALLIGRQRV